MQYKFILASAAILSLAACAPAQVPPADDGQTTSVNPAADDSNSMVDDNAAMDQGSMMDDAMTGPRVVDITITDWSFSPATVTAKQGENVTLRLKGDKGIHSLLVADLNLNIRVAAGDTTTVTLPTDKAGTFEGRCGVPCGPGHRDMKFTIVVE